MMPLTRSRSSLVRWRPPRLAGGISGLTSAHSSSVRSLGYRSSSRLCRARVAVFHMSHLTKRWRPGNHGRSSGFKSSFLVARQPTHMTRKPPGRTLREMVLKGPDPERNIVIRWRCADLCEEVAERWSVRVCEQTMGTWLRRLEMTRLQPRPYHPKKDPEAEVTFKKTSA